MFAKNLINRNKMDNRAKTDIKTLILCHLYKTISMDISSGSNSDNERNTKKDHRFYTMVFFILLMFSLIFAIHLV